MTAHLWTIEEGVAQLRSTQFGAQLAPGNPAQGLAQLTVDSAPLTDVQVLQVRIPRLRVPVEVEAYVRGGDLVANYAEQDELPLATQIYWRAAARLRPGTLAAIELIAAVHTSCLDITPAITVRSEIVASEIFQMTNSERGTFASVVPKPDRSEVHDEAGLPRCYLFRLPGGRYSYAEMVHPADPRQSTWEGWLAGPDFRLQLSHELFAERLEKGVILKSQVLGVFLDRATDRNAAAAHYAAFLNQELPLTA